MISSFSKAKWAKKAAVLSFSFVLTLGASVPAAFAEDPIDPNSSSSSDSASTNTGNRTDSFISDSLDPASTVNTDSPAFGVSDFTAPVIDSTVQGAWKLMQKTWSEVLYSTSYHLVDSIPTPTGDFYTIVREYISKKAIVLKNDDPVPVSDSLPWINSRHQMSFAEYRGVLYVAYQDSQSTTDSEFHIKKLEDGAWKEIANGLAVEYAGNIVLKAGDDRLYLAYTDSRIQGGLTLRSYPLTGDAPAEWNLVANEIPADGADYVGQIQMEVIDNQPFIMYSVGNTLKFASYQIDSSDASLTQTAKDFNIATETNNAWGESFSYTTDALGTHIVTFETYEEGPVLQVYSYTEGPGGTNAWTSLGTPQTGAKTGADSKSVAIDQGQIYVAYYAPDKPQPVIAKYAQGVWKLFPRTDLDTIPDQGMNSRQEMELHVINGEVYFAYAYIFDYVDTRIMSLKFSKPAPGDSGGLPEGGSGNNGGSPGSGSGTPIVTPVPVPTDSPVPTPSVTTPVPNVASPSSPSVANLLPVIVGGKKVSALSSAQTSNVGGIRMTNFKLDEAKILSELPNSGNGGIIVPLAESANKLTGEISGKLLGSLRQDNLPLTIRTPDFSVKLPASGLNVRSASGMADVDAVYNIEVSAPSEAETESLNKAIAERGGKRSDLAPLKFSLAAGAGAKEAWNDKFENYAEYSVKLPTGVSSVGLTGVTLNPDGTLKPLPTRIVEQDGEKYAVVKTLEGAGVSFMNAQSSYADTDNHWSRSAVEDLSARQILNGERAGQFAPNRPVTRAEFAAAVVRAYALYDRGTERSFNDVNASDWYAEAVRTAAQWNLINGQSGGGFAPERTISREEAAAILGRAQSALTPDTTADGSASMQLGSFADSGEVSDWSRSAVEQMVRQGVIRGYDGSLKPGSDVTRGETAAMLQRLLSQSELID